MKTCEYTCETPAVATLRVYSSAWNRMFEIPACSDHVAEHAGEDNVTVITH